MKKIKEKITYKEAIEFYLSCVEYMIKSEIALASLPDSFWKDVDYNKN